MKLAAIFDLDGVLVDTARLHRLAWETLAAELGIDVAEVQLEGIRGVDRMASLQIVLGEHGEDYHAAQKEQLAERKNRIYRQSIANLSAADVLPGANAALAACRERGLRIAVASSSRNAAEIVRATGMTSKLDALVDGRAIARAKPDPEVFLRAAELLAVQPGQCIAVDDAAAGIVAIKSANMYAIGIGAVTALAAAGADAIIPSIAAFALDGYIH